MLSTSCWGTDRQTWEVSHFIPALQRKEISVGSKQEHRLCILCSGLQLWKTLHVLLPTGQMEPVGLPHAPCHPPTLLQKQQWSFTLWTYCFQAKRLLPHLLLSEWTGCGAALCRWQNRTQQGHWTSRQWTGKYFALVEVEVAVPCTSWSFQCVLHRHWCWSWKCVRHQKRPDNWTLVMSVAIPLPSLCCATRLAWLVRSLNRSLMLLLCCSYSEKCVALLQVPTHPLYNICVEAVLHAEEYFGSLPPVTRQVAMAGM